MEESRLFEEAKKCFETMLEEGRKTSTIDIQLMFTSAQQCLDIVQQLLAQEHDHFYTEIYRQLEASVHCHVTILEEKIQQLNDQNDQAVPSLLNAKSKDVSVGDTAVAGTGSGGAGRDRDRDLQRQAAITDTIMAKGGLTFRDIAGLTEAKQALTEAIIIPLQYPHLFTGCIKPWKRILLYGPPGTGKSRIARAMSAEINCTFYSVSSSDLISSWVGESEKLIKELFQHALLQPGRSLIFIDEVDSICRQRSSREEEHTRRMKTELLKQMEGADNSSLSDKIFLLCATNCPWELDKAFLRRFQKRIYIPLPDEHARVELMKIHTRDNNVELMPEEWHSLALQTEGYSGSDIANMTLGALFGPIRDLQFAKYWCRRDDGMFTPCNKDTWGVIVAKITDFPSDKITQRSVELSDFTKSLQTHLSTITSTELDKFQDFTKNFGERGQ